MGGVQSVICNFRDLPKVKAIVYRGMQGVPGIVDIPNWRDWVGFLDRGLGFVCGLVSRCSLSSALWIGTLLLVLLFRRLGPCSNVSIIASVALKIE